MVFDVPNLKINCAFTIQKFKEDGTVTYQGEEFHNTVLNCGLLGLKDTPLWNGFGGYMNYVNLGSSNTPVDVTQTGLGNRLYSSSTLFNNQQYDVGNVNTNPYYYGHVRVFQFNVGTCTGTLREVGLSAGNNSSYFNRQLIKDSNGNPMDLVVAADEGIRIVCEARVYMDSSFHIYSQIYKLDVKGATSGNVVLSNGSTTRTITYALLTNTGNFKREMEYWLGVGEVTNVSGTTATNFIINFHPTNAAGYNLTIQSHTLVGNSAPPELIELQSYSPPLTGTVTLTDETTLQTTDIGYMVIPSVGVYAQNHLTQRASVAQVDQHRWWGTANYSGMVVMSVGLNQFYGQVILADGSFPTNVTGVTVTKTPTIDDLSWIQTCSISAGALGVGDKYIQGFSLRNHTYEDTYPVLWVIKLNSSILLKDTEQFTFQIKFSWGRYNPE